MIICIACWIPRTTNKHSGCIIPIALSLQQRLTNAHQCYAIRTLPVLSIKGCTCRMNICFVVYKSVFRIRMICVHRKNVKQFLSY